MPPNGATLHIVLPGIWLHGYADFTASSRHTFAHGEGAIGGTLHVGTGAVFCAGHHSTTYSCAPVARVMNCGPEVGVW